MIIVDIDGTIADVTHRVHHIIGNKPDWDSFFLACDNDKPIINVIDLVNSLRYQYDIVFCTGRKEFVRDKTCEWLNKYFPFIDYQLLMTKNKDYRHDTLTKPEALKEAGIELKDIDFILEDRNSMVKHWRNLGLTCLQVAEGDF